MPCFKQVCLEALPRPKARINRPDRLSRAAGNPPGLIPVVDEDPQKPSALPTPESYEFFTNWAKKSNWKNETTVKT